MAETAAATETLASLLEQGAVQAKARDWPAAIALGHRAVALAPGDMRANFRLAVWLSGGGQQEKSATTFLATVELAPANPGVLRGAADALVRVKRFDDAVALAARAIAAQPTEAENHRCLGQAYFAAKRWDEALAAMQAAMALKPDNAGMIFQTARVQQAAGRLPEALALAEATIVAEATRPDAWRLKSALLLQMADQPGAAAAARQAVLLQPASADGHHQLALALLGSDPAACAAAAAQAVQLTPHNKNYIALAAKATAAVPPAAPAPKAVQPQPTPKKPARAEPAEARPDPRKLKRASRKKPAA